MLTEASKEKFLELCGEGDLDIVKTMLADMIIHTYCLGRTPLLSAARSGKIETVKFLASKGSSLEEKDNHGEFFNL